MAHILVNPVELPMIKNKMHASPISFWSQKKKQLKPFLIYSTALGCVLCVHLLDISVCVFCNEYRKRGRSTMVRALLVLYDGP
jgi:hypothetical protein